MHTAKKQKGLASLKFLSFLLTGSVLLLFAALIVFMFTSNTLKMLKRHEQENIRQQGNIAEGIISASNANIQAVTRDWSSWDETYAFARGENADFVEEHMNEYPFLLHNLNFAAIKSADGADLYAEFYDVAAEQSMPVPAGFTDQLSQTARDLLENYNPNAANGFKDKLGKDGFLFYEGVAYYICAMPILTSDESSQPAGTFFFGRIFDAAEMARIIGYQNLNYAIIDKALLERDGFAFFGAEAFTFSRGSFIYYRTLADYWGEGNVVLKLEEPRSLYMDGIRVISLTCAVTGLAAFLMALLFIFMMNRFFMRPLVRLTSDMESITAATSAIDTGRYGRNREFYILGASINKMLQRLEDDRVRLDESTVSTNVLKSILNGMDAYLYVSDTETDEILFINDKMKQHFGLGDDAVGSICWQVLQSGFEKRCAFCPNHQLEKNPGEPIIWEEHNTVTGQYYRNADRIIEWANGKKVHMQHSADITDIKIAEAALKKRLKQQELMSAISQSFTSTKDTHLLINGALKAVGQFLSVNQAFLSVYKKEEGALECLYEWYDEAGQSFVESENRWPITSDMEVYNDLIENGYAAVTDWKQLTHPNFDAVKEHDLGAFLNVRVEVSGEFWGVLGFIIYGKPYNWDENDIHLAKLTEGILSGVISRNIAEESLFNTKQMLSAVLENAPMGIFWKDRDLIYRGSNAYFERFMGKTESEIAGKGDFDLFRPEVASITYGQDAQLAQSEDMVSSQDIQLENGEGELRWIHVNRSMIKDNKGQPIFLIGVLEDITERKEAEEDLLRMSAIVNTAPQYIAYVNREGKFAFFNPATHQLTGYTHDELADGGMQILYSEETNKRIREEIFPAIHAHGKYDFELPLVRKDGEVRIMSFSGFVVESAEYGIGTIASDVTEQKHMEAELIKARDAAEMASRAKGEFLSRMSHEMRTPMNAIIGMMNIAQNSSDPQKKDYCLEKIGGASTHLLGVINDILDMSKIEAGKFELSPTTFMFERMLQKVVSVITFSVDQKHQEFIVNIDGNIPGSLIGDEQRLVQVITNLLSNAVKFTPENGSVRLSARLKSEENGTCVILIEVSDTGIGIAPEQQSRIFTPFEQAENSTSRKFGGTGLGLAISKNIVELMGGTIWIESELGKGSTFAFTIKAGRGREKRSSLLNPGVDRSSLRLLVVDDMPDIREYFADVAKRFGIACDTASSGEEAIELIRRRGVYNLYFVDWKMPGMNGIELSRLIKKDYADNAIIIMISATEWNVIESEAKDAGVDVFLSKPLFPSAIAECINECLGLENILSESGMYKEEADNFEGLRALLVDDVEINREIVLALLEPTRLAIDCAENGVEAVRLFSEAPERYDLIFMDIQMPEMDGYEATRVIRRLDNPKAKSVPIIAMTANVFKEDVERCLAEGMNSHVSKPINMEELMGALRNFLTKHR